MEKKRIYIAGPMTGYPNFNYPTFNAVANYFRSHDFEVFNPAATELSQKLDGEVKISNEQYRACLKEDLSWICESATDIAMIPGWENSKGATAEWSLAKALGLNIRYLTKDTLANIMEWYDEDTI